jgi:hypothetical protein
MRRTKGYDTGWETTTVYGPEQNIVYASDILKASGMFGIDGNITPVIRVKRYVSLRPIRLFEADITYYVDINLPILTVGLLVSVFRAQSPDDQDRYGSFLEYRTAFLVTAFPLEL